MGLSPRPGHDGKRTSLFLWARGYSVRCSGRGLFGGNASPKTVFHPCDLGTWKVQRVWCSGWSPFHVRCSSACRVLCPAVGRLRLQRSSTTERRLTYKMCTAYASLEKYHVVYCKLLVHICRTKLLRSSVSRYPWTVSVCKTGFRQSELRP